MIRGKTHNPMAMVWGHLSITAFAVSVTGVLPYAVKVEKALLWRVLEFHILSPKPNRCGVGVACMYIPHSTWPCDLPSDFARTVQTCYTKFYIFIDENKLYFNNTDRFTFKYKSDEYFSVTHKEKELKVGRFGRGGRSAPEGLNVTRAT